jgi:hypothetical protein
VAGSALTHSRLTEITGVGQPVHTVLVFAAGKVFKQLNPMGIGGESVSSERAQAGLCFPDNPRAIEFA